jgi:hypothetical protein
MSKRHRWDTPTWKQERGSPYWGRCLDCGLSKTSECMEGTSYEMWDANGRYHHWRRAPPCPPFEIEKPARVSQAA